jgi:hypothetical protein
MTFVNIRWNMKCGYCCALNTLSVWTEVNINFLSSSYVRNVLFKSLASWNTDTHRRIKRGKNDKTYSSLNSSSSTSSSLLSLNIVVSLAWLLLSIRETPVSHFGSVLGNVFSNISWICRSLWKNVCTLMNGRVHNFPICYSTYFLPVRFIRCHTESRRWCGATEPFLFNKFITTIYRFGSLILQ